jgi:hypothetical protein
MLRQPDDARAAIAVTARALDPTQRHTDGSLRVARLNAQVQVNHGAATVTVDNQPMMFGNERGGNLGPEPRLAISGIEPAHGGQRLALCHPRQLHVLYGLASLMVVRATIFFWHNRFTGQGVDVAYSL